MPINQTDNTRVAKTTVPTGSYTHYDPKSPKPGAVHDTGTIDVDYSNPIQKAMQTYTANYLNSNFANSPFMDVMRWLPGLSFAERVVTGQPVEDGEALSMVMPGFPSTIQKVARAGKVTKDIKKTNYSLLERPSKLSRAEKLGVPKADRAAFNEFEEVMKNAEEFAISHNLKVPETLEEAKNMYREYNSFYRRVYFDKMLNGDVEMGKYASLPKESQAKILATRGYPASAYTYDPNDYGNFFWDRVFVSPNLNATKMYEGNGGYLVKVQRPFKLSDMKNAHKNAEFYPKYSGTFQGKLKKGEVLQTQHASEQPWYDGSEYLVSTEFLIPKEIIQK